ncbi:unnamed protein product [Pylaiella littoralis]
MPGRIVARAAVLLLGLAVASIVRVEGQLDGMDFDGYGDMYGGGYGDMYGGMGGMGDMMPGLAGMMGGMGGMGGMGYGGYGYGDQGPSHTDLTDMDDVEKFMAADPQSPCVIGFFDEETENDDIMNFRTAAQRMSMFGVRFGLATEDDVRQALKYKTGRVMAYPAKRFMAEGDRAKLRYPGSNGALDPESLQIWVLKSVTPLVGLFTWENGARYQEIGLPELAAYTKVDLEEKGDEFDKIATTLRAVASARLPQKELSYVIANAGDMVTLMSMFKFPDDAKSPEDGGVFVGIRKENEFYRMDGEFDEKTVADFADAYAKGLLKPVHVEEMEDDGDEDVGNGGGESDIDESNVVVLTPDNFEEVVKGEGKDVMLEFYAPWCGHCTSLKPIYAEVAAEVSGMSSVVVAKMDADAHTPPEEFKLESYPTLMFLKAGDKSNPIPYVGARDRESIVAFIRENATPSAPSAEL